MASGDLSTALLAEHRRHVVDVAYRINTHGDYAVANALCLMSLIVAGFGAWFYLRHASKAIAQ